MLAQATVLQKFAMQEQVFPFRALDEDEAFVNCSSMGLITHRAYLSAFLCVFRRVGGTPSGKQLGMSRERDREGRAGERGRENGRWWTVESTSTESAYWTPFVLARCPFIQPGGPSPSQTRNRGLRPEWLGPGHWPRQAHAHPQEERGTLGERGSLEEAPVGIGAGQVLTEGLGHDSGCPKRLGGGSDEKSEVLEGQLPVGVETGG